MLSNPLLFSSNFLLLLGPSASVLWLYVSTTPRLLLLSMASAFYWLIMALLISIIYQIIMIITARKNNDGSTVTALAIYGPILLELGRVFYYYILARIKPTLNLIAAASAKANNRGSMTSNQGADAGQAAQTARLESEIMKLVPLDHDLASGFGFGVMSSLMQSVQLLAQSSGPGIIPCRSCLSIDITFIGCFVGCIFVGLNSLWSVTCYHALEKKNYLLVAWVFMSHLACSMSTLLIGSDTITGGCWISLAILLLLFAVEVVICVKLVRKLKQI